MEPIDPDKHDAWVLRAGAELWKSVVAEGEHPAEDTRQALQAVRAALNAARCLRYATGTSEAERQSLVHLVAQAEAEQTRALHRWGRGRGMDWGEDWGEHWGETLIQEISEDAASLESSGSISESSLKMAS